jgi:Domain of unknown function (DUF4389)
VQGTYPLNLDVTSPPTVERWRPLVNWILIIPHSIWLYILLIAAGVLAFLGWFVILFTGRLPESWGDFIIGVLRYQWRVYSYLYAWTTTYPSFSPPAGYVDPGDYAAIFYCARPETRNRFTVALRLILAIPQFIVLYIVGIAAGVVLFLAWFAVLFTGRWPDSFRSFGVGFFRWYGRLAGYLHLVTDEYPPFSMQP